MDDISINNISASSLRAGAFTKMLSSTIEAIYYLALSIFSNAYGLLSKKAFNEAHRWYLVWTQDDLIPNVPEIDQISFSPYLAPEIKDIKVEESLLKELNLSKEQMLKLLNYWDALVVDPIKFLSFLKPLDTALEEKMKDKIQFTEENLPTYFLPMRGYLVPGPPQQPLATKKNHILDKTLLEMEQSLGINKEGTPVFIGFVDNAVSNPFIMEGNMFKEDVQVSNILMHGKNTHRLAILALILSLKGTEFENLKATDVLKILLQVKDTEDSLFWLRFIDSVGDQYDGLLSENLNFSCKSPFVMNSLLLCFGDRLGLPNLRNCMYDSFCKQVNKMAVRVQKSHDDILKTLNDHPYDISVIGVKISCALEKEKARQDSKYIATEHTGIYYKKQV